MVEKVFSGGDKLEAALKQLAQKVRNPGTLEVGFMEGATQTGVSRESAAIPVAMVAAINEFGAPARGIPPRPFFRDMIAKGSPQWGSQVAALLKASDYDATAALDMMGEEIKGQLTESIRNFSDPPNAESTIERKGFNDPLIDTGDMMRAITSRIKT